MTARAEHRIALDTGVALAYVDQGPHSSTAIVCLPGWPDPWQSYELVLDRLPEDVRAIAVSQRGCGNSERPPNGYGPAGLAADVVAFLDAVAVGSAILLGHSLGAFVAQRVAIDRPDRIDGLALIGGFATLHGTPAIDGIGRAMAEIDDPVDPAFARRVTASAIGGNVPEAFIETIVAEGLKAPSRVWRAGLAGLLDADHTAQLGGITAPTLLLWGDRDALISRASQEALASLIANARLVVIAGAGHSPNWETRTRWRTR